jgi:Na+/proline symporter
MIFARSGSGILELVNMVGSAFYGPVLAVFVLGVLAPRVTGRAALSGLAAGLASNFTLAATAPGIPWLWWNPAGFLVSAAVALSFGIAGFQFDARWARRESALLLGAFAIMLGFLAAFPKVFALLR